MKNLRASTILALAICAFSLLYVTAGPARAQSGWPATINSVQGFQDLGRAISHFSDFPANRSEIEKARFVFAQLPAIVTRYGLKPGSGSTLSNLTIQLYRWFGEDPEDVLSLKRIGWGNCGEWAYAMAEILAGASVTSRPVYADKSDSPGHSGAFTGTDTTLYVEEVTSDGHVSRRVFDAFRVVYHSPNNVPNSYWLHRWSDVPLTDYDKLPRDAAVGRESWLSTVGKPYVKDASTEKLVDTYPDKRRPTKPGASTATVGLGTSWDDEEQNGWKATWTRQGNSDMFKASFFRGSEQFSAVVRIRIEGSKVTAERWNSSSASGKPTCTYNGTVGANGVVVGTGFCPSGNYSAWDWHATIHGSAPGNASSESGFAPRVDNTTYLGTTLRFFGVNDIAQCENACVADPQCRGYSLVKRGAYASNPNNAVCYLHSSLGQRRNSSCCITAVKNR